MHIVVQEMTNTDMPSGGHIWVDLHFPSGRMVTVRVDEFSIVNECNASVYLSCNNQTGKEVTV